MKHLTLKSKINIYIVLTALTFSFLTLLDFQIYSVYFFAIFQVLFCGYSCIQTKKLLFSKDYLINLIFISLAFSTFASLFSVIPISFKKYAVEMFVLLLLSYFMFTYFWYNAYKMPAMISCAIRALKVGILVQLIWIPLQYVLYHACGLDLNALLFRDVLHLMDSPTFFRQGVFYPSGMTWHSAVLAAVFPIAFALFRKPTIRCLIILDALICGNTTAFIGTIVCCLMLLLNWIYQNKKVSRKSLQAVSVIIIVLLFISFKFDLITPIVKKIGNMYSRIFAANFDTSSQAHFSYFTTYPQVFKNGNVINNLFGYGYGTSGALISAINGQYATLKHWSVECDIIDILISRGIFGFAIYYGFLFAIVHKGRKVNFKYCAVMIAILIEGLGYNVQFEFLFFLELILYKLIELKIDIFSPDFLDYCKVNICKSRCFPNI